MRFKKLSYIKLLMTETDKYICIAVIKNYFCITEIFRCMFGHSLNVRLGYLSNAFIT